MFLYSKWISLSLPTRIKIAEIFGIVKRGSTEVFNNMIKSDGYDIKEVEQALNVDALQGYLQTEETDMVKLFERLIDVIEGREIVVEARAVEFKEIVGSVGETITIEEKIIATGEPKKKAGRPKKIK